MYVKFKNLKNNEKVRRGGGLIWKTIGVFSTIGGGIFGITYIRDIIWKPRKLNQILYDEDIMNEALDIKKKAWKKGIDLDVDDLLNELQRNKNIKKDE